MSMDQRVHAGQAIYNPFTLKAYDWFVLGFSNRYLWRCPTAELEALYARNVTPRHLDIGVGTGYFLDKVTWPVPDPEITLVDLNQHSLNAAARRIARFSPQTVVANILEPMLLLQTFDSVGLCYLLHCLPGTIRQKAVIFDKLLPVMTEGATIFGATILQGDTPRSRPAQALMNFYNSRGIFSNRGDYFYDLSAALKQRFTDVRIKRRGTVAIFEARKGR